MSDSEDNQAFRRELAKKKRGANFTPGEVHILLTLVSDMKHIIENKKTDGVSMQEKNVAWKKITNLFNSSCPQGNYRTMDSLKKLYDNKKRDIRKKKAEERKEVLLTGGGPPTKKSADIEDDLLLSIVDPLTILGGSSIYGSDSIPLDTHQAKSDDYIFEFENVDEHNKREQVLEEVIIGTDDEEQPSTSENREKRVTQSSSTVYSVNWKKSADLLEPISTPLKRPAFDKNKEIDNNKNMRNLKRRRPSHTVVRALSSNQLTEKYNLLADKKNTLADYALKKIKLDITHSEEEHALKMESLRLDVELKKKQLNCQK